MATYNIGVSTPIAVPDINDYGISASWPAWANKYTSVAAGAITSCGAYVSKTTGTPKVRIAIYKADGDGNIPGTLIGLSPEMTVPGTEGWVTADWDGPNIAAATDYWIALLCSDGNVKTDYYNDGVTLMQRKGTVPYNGYTEIAQWGAIDSGGFGGMTAKYVTVDDTITRGEVTISAHDAGVDDNYTTTAVTPDTTGVAKGDLMVMFAASLSETLSPPAGWTQEFTGTYGGFGVNYRVWSKVADANAPTESFTKSGSCPYQFSFYALRNIAGQTYDQMFVDKSVSDYAAVPAHALVPSNIGDLILVADLQYRGSGGGMGAISLSPPTVGASIGLEAKIEDVGGSAANVYGPAAGLQKRTAVSTSALKVDNVSRGQSAQRGVVLTASFVYEEAAPPPAAGAGPGRGLVMPAVF